MPAGTTLSEPAESAVSPFRPKLATSGARPFSETSQSTSLTSASPAMSCGDSRRRGRDPEDLRDRRLADVEVREDDVRAAAGHCDGEVGRRRRLALVRDRARHRDDTRPSRAVALDEVCRQEPVGVAVELFVSSEHHHPRPAGEALDGGEDRSVEELLDVLLRPDLRVERLADADEEQREHQADHRAEQRVAERAPGWSSSPRSRAGRARRSGSGRWQAPRAR